MAEECCRIFAKEWDVPVAIIRFFSLYGEGLRKQLLWDACRKAVQGQFAFFGDGTEMRDWLHIQDAMKLVAIAVDKATPECPVVNGGTGSGVTVKEILTHLGGLLHPVRVPAFSGCVKPGDPHHQIAGLDVLGQWGFSPSVLWQEGIRAYVDWFQKEQGVC